MSYAIKYLSWVEISTILTWIYKGQDLVKKENICTVYLNPKHFVMLDL